MHTYRARRAAAALAAALLATLSACGDGDDGEAEASAEPTAAASVEPSTSAEPSPSPAASSSAGPSPSASASAGPQLLWPAPSDPMARTAEAGLTAETIEKLAYHVHAHLDVFVDGRPVLIPGGIGIDTAAPEVKRFDDSPLGPAYGGIEKDCAKPCISPLHTHDPDGILHTESATETPNNLGQFFVEWGVKLSSDCLADRCGGVSVYIDGEKFTGDPKTVELKDHREIALVVGTPPAEIPKTADFSRA